GARSRTGRSATSRRARASRRGWRRGSPWPTGSPYRRRSTSRDRSPGPNAICCWARSRSSPLRSFGRLPSGVDRSRPELGEGPIGDAAEIDLFLDALIDAEPRCAQHRLGAGAVRNPPVGPVAAIFALDEMELRIARFEELIGLGGLISGLHLDHVL